jgi:hypothetical protein
MEPLQTNAGDDEQVSAGRRIERARERRRRAVLRQQLSTTDGREYVWGLLAEMRIFAAIHGDEQQVYMALGLRNYGTAKLAELVARHPKEYLLMQQEAMARTEREQREALAARTKPAATT